MNWKEICKSKGYLSLKAAYIAQLDDIDKTKRRGHRPMRDKKEFYTSFQWVINRAKHYSKHLNRPIESILDEWEDKRTYGILNYYQNGNQPKFHSNSRKPQGINGIRKYLQKCYKGDKAKIAEHIGAHIISSHNKEKNRWTAARKKRGY